MPLPLLKVDASIYEQFIVPTTNGSGNDSAGTEPVTLTDKQILLLYMSGVRPDEIKHTHASEAARNQYLSQHKEASEAFREREKTPICPGRSSFFSMYEFFHLNDVLLATGHVHEILEKLTKTYGLCMPKKPIRSQEDARTLYKSIQNKTPLAADYYDFARCYALGADYDILITGTRTSVMKLREYLEKNYHALRNMEDLESLQQESPAPIQREDDGYPCLDQGPSFSPNSDHDDPPRPPSTARRTAKRKAST